MEYVKYVAKAIASAAVYVAFLLAIYLTGDMTLADVTTAQWLLVIVGLGAQYGIVYKVTNGPNPKTHEPLR